MLRAIDKFGGFVIQKVTNHKGKTLRYQTVAENAIGDASAIVPHKTLLDARIYLKMPAPKNVFRTLAKSECPHNQKGYRADNRKGGK